MRDEQPRLPVGAGGPRAYGQPPAVSGPDRPEALPLPERGGDKAFRGGRPLVGQVDALPRGGKPRPVGFLCLACAAAALRKAAAAALRAPFGADARPLLGGGAHLAREVRARADAAAGPAVLAGRKPRRALPAGASARLATAAPGASDGGLRVARRLLLAHGPVRLCLPSDGRGARSYLLRDLPGRLSFERALFDRLPALLGHAPARRPCHGVAPSRTGKAARLHDSKGEAKTGGPGSGLGPTRGPSQTRLFLQD